MVEETVVLDVPEDSDSDQEIEWAYVGASPEVLAELLQLHQEGKLDPESVAQRAQDPDSALHSIIFREDDGSAAWRHRIDLAQRLVQRVRIVPVRVKIDGGGVREMKVRAGRPARAFFSVRDDGRHHYQLTPQALAERREYVLAELDREIRNMIQRRVSILSLDDIEDAVKGVIATVREEYKRAGR